MSDSAKITIGEKLFATVSDWGNIVLILNGEELFMLRCDDEIKIGCFVHFFGEYLEEYTCTEDIIKGLDWKFTGSCVDNPFPFGENFYRFYQSLLNNF